MDQTTKADLSTARVSLCFERFYACSGPDRKPDKLTPKLLQVIEIVKLALLKSSCFTGKHNDSIASRRLTRLSRNAASPPARPAEYLLYTSKGTKWIRAERLFILLLPQKPLSSPWWYTQFGRTQRKLTRSEERRVGK